MSSLRVCVDARLVSGVNGGVEQFIIGLISGVAALKDGDEEYYFLVYEDSVEWLLPYLRDGHRLLLDGPAPRPPRWMRVAKRLAPFARRAWHGWRFLSRLDGSPLPGSSGVIEREGIHVMHFTKQSGFLTGVLSIYHPHDLQYLHLPEFFTPRVRRGLDASYRALCAQAEMVAVASCWVKRDVVAQFGLDEDKVQVVPLAAPVLAYPEPSEDDLMKTSSEFALPDAFLFYPAQTWPHKNHIELLRALGLLRDRYGLRIPLVCSGQLTAHIRQIRSFAESAGVTDQVTFLGFVSPLTLQCLYRLCRAVVIPTRFEAGSFPMMEAFSTGAPVACSNVTSLPEQAGDAALIFDPTDPADMAEAIRRLWTDASLRQTLIERGRRRQQTFSWTETARMFRAHYRRIGGRPLSEEDMRLLALALCG
jgi:glycosyltransferase involved in cell wall biosynthesis